jgi:hypothetical protein
MKRVLFAIIMLVLFMAWIGSTTHPTSQSAAVAETKPPVTVAETKKALPVPAFGEHNSEEYFNQVYADAAWPCKTAIENSAKFDLRWTQSWIARYFNRWNSVAREDGHLILVGDTAEAQNGFGGWVRVHYRCEFDPASKKVINASFEPGKIAE